MSEKILVEHLADGRWRARFDGDDNGPIEPDPDAALGRLVRASLERLGLLGIEYLAAPAPELAGSGIPTHPVPIPGRAAGDCPREGVEGG